MTSTAGSRGDHFKTPPADFRDFLPHPDDAFGPVQHGVGIRAHLGERLRVVWQRTVGRQGEYHSATVSDTGQRRPRATPTQRSTPLIAEEHCPEQMVRDLRRSRQSARGFLPDEVPKGWTEICDLVADNFRIISSKIFGFWAGWVQPEKAPQSYASRLTALSSNVLIEAGDWPSTPLFRKCATRTFLRQISIFS